MWLGAPLQDSCVRAFSAAAAESTSSPANVLPQVCTKGQTGHYGAVLALAATDRYICSAGSDALICVWHKKTLALKMYVFSTSQPMNNSSRQLTLGHIAHFAIISSCKMPGICQNLQAATTATGVLRQSGKDMHEAVSSPEFVLICFVHLYSVPTMLIGSEACPISEGGLNHGRPAFSDLPLD